MPILKFLFATLVTALCLDSVATMVMVWQDRPDLMGWVASIFFIKLLIAAGLVGIAAWGRSAWRGWHG